MMPYAEYARWDQVMHGRAAQLLNDLVLQRVMNTTTAVPCLCSGADKKTWAKCGDGRLTLSRGPYSHDSLYA